MTEDASPENLRKFLESDDPALIRMGLSMAKGSGVPDDLLEEILWLYMMDDDTTIRAAAKSTFMKLAQPDAKKAVKENWKANYRTTYSSLGDNLYKLEKNLSQTSFSFIKQLIKWLGTINATEEALSRIGKTVVEPLIRAFEDKKQSMSYRQAAVRVLINISDKRAVEPLIKALRDEEHFVRQAAAEALWKIGDVRAVEPLINALGDEISAVRKYAVLSLGQSGDERAIEPLITTLNDDISEVMECAVEALGKLGDKRAVDPLIKILNSKIGVDDRICTKVVKALGSIGDSRAVEPFIEALKNRNESLDEIGDRDYRVASQDCLDWGFSGSAEFPRAEISPGTRAKCLASRKDIIKGELRIAVEKFGVEDGEMWITVGYILPKNFEGFFDNMKVCLSLDRRINPTPWPRVFLDTDNWDNTVNVLMANSQHESTSHRKKTYPPLPGERFDELNEIFGGVIGSRYCILKALGEIVETQAVGPFIKALGDDDEDIRYTAAKTLGKIGDARAVEPLIETLRDEDSEVRAVAAEALMTFGESSVRKIAEEALDKLKWKPETDEGKAEPVKTDVTFADPLPMASGTKYKSKSAPSSKPEKGDWVSATKTRNFMNRDPILDWLDLYGNEENKDTKDKKYDANLDFVQLLFRKGHEFEKKVANHLKKKFISAKFVTVSANSAGSKYPAKEQETLQHMKDGVDFILQGVLRNPDNKTYGMPDIMVRNNILSKIPENEEYQSFFNIGASSELGNYHYRIIDVKFTTLNYNADGTYLLGSSAHKAQLAIYNQALGRMQGFIPPEAYLLGRNWKRTKNGIEIPGEGALDRLGVVDFFNTDREFNQKANDAVEWIRRVRSEGSAWEVTPKPTVEELWPNCKNQSDYPWHNVKAMIADELNELTKVWQIGPRERERAHANGIFGWNDPDLTPEKIGITGAKRANIMREVLNINNQDRFKVLPEKIDNNDKNWQQKPKLEFFVDFETVSNIEDDFSNFPRQGGQELIFMIGCGFERNGKFEIEVFTAKNLSIEEEARIMTEWFDYMERVKSEILGPDAEFPNIFHWSPAELTFMGVAQNNLEGDERKVLDKIYKERRDMIKNWKDLPWFDFLKVMKAEPIVVKDAFGFGLKAIATNLEKHGLTTTTWEDGPADGLGAMVGAWHCDKIEGIDMDQTELMQGIKEYNIIDCKTMWDLINYLRKKHT